MSKPIPQVSKMCISPSQYTGIAILACGPAILWSSSLPEEDGVHIHAYKHDKLTLDTTVGFVEIGDMKCDSVSTKFDILKMLLSLNYSKEKND